jgi:hypothetical protein
MERPFFSVSKRSRSSSEYTSPDGSIDIRIEAGPTGMATIFDADLLMFLVDQIAGAGLLTASSLVLKPANYFAAVGSKCGPFSMRTAHLSRSSSPSARRMTRAPRGFGKLAVSNLGTGLKEITPGIPEYRHRCEHLHALVKGRLFHRCHRHPPQGDHIPKM